MISKEDDSWGTNTDHTQKYTSEFKNNYERLVSPFRQLYSYSFTASDNLIKVLSFIFTLSAISLVLKGLTYYIATTLFLVLLLGGVTVLVELTYYFDIELYTLLTGYLDSVVMSSNQHPAITVAITGFIIYGISLYMSQPNSWYKTTTPLDRPSAIINEVPTNHPFWGLFEIIGVFSVLGGLLGAYYFLEGGFILQLIVAGVLLLTPAIIGFLYFFEFTSKDENVLPNLIRTITLSVATLISVIYIIWFSSYDYTVFYLIGVYGLLYLTYTRLIGSYLIRDELEKSIKYYPTGRWRISTHGMYIMFLAYTLMGGEFTTSLAFIGIGLIVSLIIYPLYRHRVKQSNSSMTKEDYYTVTGSEYIESVKNIYSGSESKEDRDERIKREHSHLFTDDKATLQDTDSEDDSEDDYEQELVERHGEDTIEKFEEKDIENLKKAGGLIKENLNGGQLFKDEFSDETVEDFKWTLKEFEEEFVKYSSKDDVNADAVYQMTKSDIEELFETVSEIEANENIPEPVLRVATRLRKKTELILEDW